MLDFDRMVSHRGTHLYGVRVQYQPIVGQAAMRSGVFDRMHIEVGFGQDGAVVSASQSRIMTRLAEWGDPKQGDAVDVRIRQGRATHIDTAPLPGDVVLHYLISDVQPDSIGGALLILGARSLAAGESAAGGLPYHPGAQVVGS